MTLFIKAGTNSLPPRYANFSLLGSDLSYQKLKYLLRYRARTGSANGAQLSQYFQTLVQWTLSGKFMFVGNGFTYRNAQRHVTIMGLYRNERCTFLFSEDQPLGARGAKMCRSTHDRRLAWRPTAGKGDLRPHTFLLKVLKLFGNPNRRVRQVPHCGRHCYIGKFALLCGCFSRDRQENGNDSNEGWFEGTRSGANTVIIFPSLTKNEVWRSNYSPYILPISPPIAR